MSSGDGACAPEHSVVYWTLRTVVVRLFAGTLLAASSPIALSDVSFADTIGIPPQQIQNFYGEAGLLDMPSGRFQPDGEVSFTMSAMPIGERYSLGFQALPWLETEFRYARIDRITVNRDDYDRSLGFKIRLSQEDDFWPSIAIGAQDILGTGAYGAEYLVASKRIGSLDFTLGTGWRRFDGFASFENPLGYISKRYLRVPGRGAQGGTPLISQFFRGPKAGLFGGVTWDTPIEGLALIAEVSGDAYTQQQQTGAIDVKTPLNFGFSYDLLKDLQISGGYMYGTQWGIRISILMNGFDDPPKPRLGVQPMPVHVRSPEERSAAVLSLLQNTTNYYDEPLSSILTPLAQQADVGSSIGDEMPDALFNDATAHKVSVRNIETFGRELLVDVSGSRKAVNCSNFVKATQTAHSAKFEEIVFSVEGSAQIELCPTDRTIATSNGAMPLSVSLAETDPAASGDSSSSILSTSAQTDTLKEQISKAFEDQRIGLVALQISPRQVDVAVTNYAYFTEAEAIGRVLRILMALSPNGVEIFRIVSVAGGAPTNSLTFSRSDIERTLGLYGTAGDILPTTKIAAIDDDDPLLTEGSQISYPDFSYYISPGYRQSLFDPDQPYRFQIFASMGGGVSLTPNISVLGGFELNIYNTFGSIARTSNSVLPHVRSDFAEYYKHGINGFSDIMALYVGKLSPDVYVTARAGYLESMFAGVGGEIYWQPPNSRLSFGGSLFAVQQRNFNRLFGLQNYKVVTGHVSAYYNSPFYDLNFEMHVGRYLAGDWGATFQATRRFASGVEIGAYFTLTNVPFSKFGEGSFDKGIIIHIPIDDMVPVNTQDEMNLDFSPLTRDGGQRLEGEETLHSILDRSSKGELLPTWDEVLRP